MLERSMWGSSGVSNGFEFIRVDMVMDVCMIICEFHSNTPKQGHARMDQRDENNFVAIALKFEV
jgi:hypothetical protein